MSPEVSRRLPVEVPSPGRIPGRGASGVSSVCSLGTTVCSVALTGVLKLFAIPAHISKASIAVRQPAYGPARLLASALLVALVTWEVPEIVPRLGFATSRPRAANLAPADRPLYQRGLAFTRRAR